MTVTREEDGDTWFQMTDGTWLQERYICKHCLTATHAVEADEQYSFGVYAGRYCEACWPKSGFRDATGPGAVFDRADAGEAYWEDEY